MQPLSSHIPSTLTPSVHDFVSQTSNNVHEAWTKGLAFGFRDCHIWYGLDLKELRTPKTDTYKHPLKENCYVRISQQTSRKSAKARKRLEEAFSNDFARARKVDKRSPDAVINPFLAYDNFIHQAAQLIPPGRTIPECIFGSFAQDQKGWPRDHAEVRKSLSWLVQKLTICRNQKSVILLMATWVELSSAMATQRLGCSSLRGKAYFDWSEVFAYVRNPDLLSSANATASPAPSSTTSESGSSSSEADTPPPASATKETATEVTVVIAPATLLPTHKSGAKPLDDQSAPDKEKEPSKTKSGRPIKRKTGLTIQFPPPKRGKLMLKHA